MVRWLVYLAARYLCKAGRWKGEEDSVCFRGITADSPAPHLRGDCSMAQWPVYSAARYLSKAARWTAHQDSADFLGMAADNSAGHLRGDCLVAPRPQVVPADSAER